METIPLSKPEIRALTGLRGVAAIGVTFYHFFYDFSPGPHTMLQRALSRGYLMVDVFFILSGFVMAMTYNDSFQPGRFRAAWLRFMVKRVARIYPLYAVALVGAVALALGAFGTVRTVHWTFPVYLPGGARDLLFNALLVQAWSLAPSALGPAWSLSTEWAAYVLFPLLVLALLRSRPAFAGVAGLVIVAALVAVAGMVHTDGMFHVGDMDASHGELPSAVLRCLAGFGIGMLLFRCSRSRWLQFAATDWFGWTALLVAVAVWLAAPLDLFVYPVLPVLVAVAAMNTGRVGRWLGAAPVHWLGIMSYAIYLIHYQFSAPLFLLAQAYRHVLSAGLASLAAALCIYAGLLGVAVLAHRLVEVPGRLAVLRLAALTGPAPGTTSRLPAE